MQSQGQKPGNVWIIPKVTSGKGRASKERTPHPAQFPESVIERIVKASSNPGDIVFAPFEGSGTTAVVASQLGRFAVMFEINKRYCEIAKQRILKLNRYNSNKQKSQKVKKQDGRHKQA